MKRRTAFAAASGLVVILAVVPRGAPAQSQSNPPTTTNANADQLQEIIVTAEYRQTDLQKTPLAITALTGEMLDARGIVNVSEVAQSAPNVTLDPTTADYGKSTAAYIRGVGQFDFDPAFEPGVGIYIDDVYYATVFGSDFDLMDAERVEILRGPQGTLEGKNSVGGSIKFFSQQPTPDGGGYLEVAYGSFQSVDLRGAADFAAYDDKVLVRVSGISRQDGGYVNRFDYACTHPGSGYPSSATGQGCFLGTLGGTSDTGGRIYVKMLPTDQLTVTVIADYTRDTSEAAADTLLYAVPSPGTGVNLAPFVPTNPYVNYGTWNGEGGWNPAPINQDTDGGASATIDYNFSDALSFKSITGYRHVEGDWSTDDDVSPIDLITQQLHFTSNEITEEDRVTAQIGKLLDFTVGVFYYHDDIFNGGRAFDSGVFDQNEADRVQSTSRAGYSQAELSVTNDLKLIAGVRYTSDTKDYAFDRTVPDGVTEPALGEFIIDELAGKSATIDSHHTDWRVALQYQLTPDIMSYVQASTGYKGGGINPRPFYGSQVVPFLPETLLSYEAGLKTRMLDGRAQLNVAAFFSDYDNIQVGLSSGPCDVPPGAPDFCSLEANAGSAHMKGFEAEATLRPVPELLIDASASYLDFAYSSKDPFAAVGDVTPYTPRFKASLGVQYEQQIGPAGSITPRLDANYQSSIYFDAANTPEAYQDGYTVLNAKLIWRPSKVWELTGGVTNLTSKLYYLNKETSYFSAYGFVPAIPAPPREWKIALRRRF